MIGDEIGMVSQRVSGCGDRLYLSVSQLDHFTVRQRVEIDQAQPERIFFRRHKKPERLETFGLGKSLVQLARELVKSVIFDRRQHRRLLGERTKWHDVFGRFHGLIQIGSG